MNWKYALKRNKSRISHMCLWNFICVQARSHCVCESISVPVRNWKWRGTTLEKGYFSTSKTMKKGNIVIFNYLILKMSFSTTFSALCIYMTHCLYIFYYTDICTETQVKIWISIKTHVLKRILVLQGSHYFEIRWRSDFSFRCWQKRSERQQGEVKIFL